MMVGRHTRRWRWALPLACVLVACGPGESSSSVPAELVRQDHAVWVPEASPLRRALRLAGVVDTTIETANGATHRALTVPATAIVADAKTTRVYVERGPWVFEPRTVRTAGRIGSQVEISSGLQADERVVTQGARLLEP
jgi:multidrug efflux pump subunit AcrA (membrane-fusion protein)